MIQSIKQGIRQQRHDNGYQSVSCQETAQALENASTGSTPGRALEWARASPLSLISKCSAQLRVGHSRFSAMAVAVPMGRQRTEGDQP